MDKNYKYSVVEKSLTQDTLMVLFWKPILRCLPDALKPNTITIFGSIFIWLSAVFVWLAFQGYQWGFLIAALCVFIYMAADNVDGHHARRTKQSSRLGEFLDHWLDSIASIIINLSIVLSLGLHGWLFAFCLIGIALAFFATIWEHHHTGIFYSGRLGTNEGLLFVISLYILMFFFFGTPTFTYKGPFSPNIASLMAYFTLAVSIFTIIGIVLRVKKHLSEYIPIIFIMLSLAFLIITGQINLLLGGFLILATNVPFSGRFLLDKLAGKESKYRVWFAVIVTLSCLIASLLQGTEGSVHICFCYLGLMMIILSMLWDLFRAVKNIK